MVDFIKQFIDNFKYVRETKHLIKNAIKDKGVEVSDTDTFRSYANKITEIVTSPPYTIIDSYTMIGIQTSGAGNALVEGNFVIPEGVTTALILAVINTQGNAVFKVEDSAGLATINYNVNYDRVANYNNSQNVGHVVRTYTITTDGRETTINVKLGDSGGANRFVMAVGIY